MDKRTLTRSVSTSGNYVIDWATKQEEERKIDEGLALLMKRELRGKKNIFPYWTLNNLVTFYINVLREKER